MEFISRNNNKRKSEPEEIDDKTAVHDDTYFEFEYMEGKENKVNAQILINRGCKNTYKQQKK